MEQEELLIFDPVRQVRGSGSTSFRKVKIEVLIAEMQEFQTKIGKIFSNIEPTEFGYELDEISVSVEISAEGQIGILGSGAKGGAKGGLTFKFVKRQPPK